MHPRQAAADGVAPELHLQARLDINDEACLIRHMKEAP